MTFLWTFQGLPEIYIFLEFRWQITPRIHESQNSFHEKKQHPNFLFSKSTVLTFQSAAKNDALIELSWICLYEITRQLGFDFRGPSPEPVVWRPASLRQWNGGEMVQELGRSEGNGGFRSPKLSEAQAVGRRSPVVQGAPVVQRCFSTQVEWSNGGSLFVKLEDLRKVLVTTFF